MSDEPEKKDDPADELKQGLTHLWRAARGVAAGVKKEVEGTNVGKVIEDAGREFVRAAASVVDRVAVEVDAIAKPSGKPGDAPPPPAPSDDKPDEDDDFDGVRPKDKAPEAPPDPGFRIAVDDSGEKKKPE
jgi:hypothetical protein